MPQLEAHIPLPSSQPLFDWKISYHTTDPYDMVKAAYYRVDESKVLIEFKDTQNRVVFAINKALVKSIGRDLSTN